MAGREGLRSLGEDVKMGWVGSCKMKAKGIGTWETDGTRSFPVPFGAVGWMVTSFFGVERKTQEEQTLGRVHLIIWGTWSSPGV